MNLIRTRGRVVVVACAALIAAALVGCSPTAPIESTSSATPPPQAECPSPHGGVCLGALEAGTYTTQQFTPQVTYTVPEGWSNYEDLPGNFLLVPATGTLDGVDAGTSDYIGIYTSIVALELDCETVPAPTGRTPAAIAGWFAAEPALVVSGARGVQVGGLDGLVLDIVLAEGAGAQCEGLDFPIVPLFAGNAPSDVEHAMVPGLTMRLYLLAFGDGTLAIEIDDFSGGANLDEYSAIVDLILFAV